jgi:hypothetical protein
MLFTAHCSRTRSRSSALHPIQMHLSGRWRATTESRCESAVSDCRPSVRVVLLGTSTPKRSKGESETDGCVRVWSKKVDMTFRVESTLWDGRTDGNGRHIGKAGREWSEKESCRSFRVRAWDRTHSLRSSNPVTSPLGTLVGSRAFDVTWWPASSTILMIYVIDFFSF